MTTDIPLVDTAPEGVGTITLLTDLRLTGFHVASAWRELTLGATAENLPHPGVIRSHPRSEILPYIHNFNNPGKTGIPPIETAGQGV